MSDDRDDDFEDLDEYPIFNRATSTFEWRKAPSEPPKPKHITYGIEIAGGMGYVANGMRVGGMSKKQN